MPKCAVQSCKNSTKNSSNGISLFQYPRSPSQGDAAECWKVLSPVVLESFNPETPVVCSEDFRENHKLECHRRHKLAANAVPDKLLLHSWRHRRASPRRPPRDHTLDEEAMMAVCRICLVTESRLERISEEYEEAYFEVIGIKWDREDQLPQHLCWECAARLRAAARLRRRALVSRNLLRGIRTASNTVTLIDVKLIDRSYHKLTSNLRQERLPPNQYVPRTINNNQIFIKDINYESNIKYAELMSDTKMNIKEKGNFTEIVNNLIMNNTDISLKHNNSNIHDVHFDSNYMNSGYHESSVVNNISGKEEGYLRKNLESYKSEKDIVNFKIDITDNTEYVDSNINKRETIESYTVNDIDIPKETYLHNNLETYKSYLETYRPFTDNVNLRKESTVNTGCNFIKEGNIESNIINGNRIPNQSYLNNNLDNNNESLTESVNLSNNLAKITNDRYNNYTNQATIESNNVNIVSNKSDADQNLNLGRDFAVNNDLDEDSSSGCLVIDAGDEEMETVISSEYVSRTDGGMPIDELIDIYNNNGDGDEVLQELNQQFQGAAKEDNLGRGVDSANATPTAQPVAIETQTRKRRRRRSKSFASIRLVETDRAEYCMTKAYEKLDHTLFTIKSVSDEEQIAEVLKRQETYRFKRAPFKCWLCFRSFTARRAHNAHMLRHDERNGAYECVICKARQKSPRAVKTHMYGQHTVRISCNQCSFVTMNRSVARSHEKWHAGTVYQCPHCPGRFDQESTYKGHLRTQHAHAHSCALCGRTFVSAKGLAVHRCKRHADADKIPLEGPHCDVCAVRFASEGAYTIHLSMSSRHRSENVPRYIGLRETGYSERLLD